MGLLDEQSNGISIRWIVIIPLCIDEPIDNGDNVP